MGTEITSKYFEYSESLFQQFLRGKLPMIPELQQQFSWDDAPEPYVWIGSQAEITPPYLCFVQINPGKPFDFQHRRAILHDPGNVIKSNHSYREVAAKLGAGYADPTNPLRINPQSVVRYRKVKEIAEQAGLHGVLCVECIPLHRATFSADRMDPQAMDYAWLCEYAALLQQFLRTQRVLIVDAPTWPRIPSRGRTRTLAWRKWRLGLAGIDMNDIVPIEELTGDGRALWAAPNTRPAKLYYANQGSLTLPDNHGAEIIARALRR